MATRARIEELYRVQGGAVYRRCLRLLGDPAAAEEAVQEVFVRLLGRAQRLRDPDRIAHYLFRVATNYCLNRLRYEKRRYPGEGRQRDLPGAGNPEAAVALAEILERALAELPEERRLVIYLHLVDGFTLRETGAVAGISPQYAGRIVRRFQASLQAEEGRDG